MRTQTIESQDKSSGLGNRPIARGVLGRIIRFDRYMRGRKAFRHLRGCDVAVVSFGKSGRTWLRVLLSRYFQQRYGLPATAMLLYDNLHRLNAEVPIVYFTHDYYLADYTGDGGVKDPYGGCRVVLLVRDPCDTAISSYFQRKHRMRPWKKFINGYPTEGPGPSIFSFVMGESGGLPKIVRYLNAWAEALAKHESHHVVRYEDLRQDTGGTLRLLLRFLGEEPTQAELDECVAFSSVESMQRMEAEGGGGLGRRLMRVEAGDANSSKVRRAKVGGYSDYLTPEEVAEAQAYLRAKLSPVFGYHVGDSAAPADSQAALSG